MSKKEESKESPEKDFSLLQGPAGTPFDDGLEMEFNDSLNDTFAESSVAAKVPVLDDTETEEEDEEEDEESTKASEKPEEKESKKPVKKVEESKEAPDKEESEESNIQVFASWLGEQGVIDLEEDQKIDTEEDLKTVITTTIAKGIEEYKSSKPDDVQKFIDFVDNGGDPRQFHRLYYEQRSWKDIDPKSEASQELIVREALRLTGWDEDDIESEISDKKDLGKLENLAKKFHSKLIAGEESEKESLIEAQKEHKIRQANEAKEQWEAFKDNLYKKDEINGFKITPKIKDDLWNFMTKSDRKTGKTQLQTHNETNTDAQVLYAYLAMNNWDISKLEKQVKTKVASELSKKLKNITDSRNKISKGSSDSFEGERSGGTNNFSAFKNIVNQI